jgi:hypothetical protein
MREGNQNSGNITQYSTGYLQLAAGTTAQRPSSPVAGMMRYNTDLSTFEMYQFGAWQIPNFVPRTRLFYADQFDNPVTSDWSVNGLAPATTDPTNTSLTVRAFDDTAEEGVGMAMSIPSSISTITIRLKGRGASTSSSGGVVLRLHTRTVPNNSAIGAWTITTMNTLTIPANTNYQYFSQTFNLSSLNLSTGTLAQIELTRQGSATADTSSGDFYLVELGAEFA